MFDESVSFTRVQIEDWPRQWNPTYMVSPQLDNLGRLKDSELERFFALQYQIGATVSGKILMDRAREVDEELKAYLEYFRERGYPPEKLNIGVLTTQFSDGISERVFLTTEKLQRQSEFKSRADIVRATTNLIQSVISGFETYDEQGCLSLVPGFNQIYQRGVTFHRAYSNRDNQAFERRRLVEALHLKVILFAPDSKIDGIFRLQDVPRNQIQDINRLYCLEQVRQAGGIIPEMATVFTHEKFKKWYQRGRRFTSEERDFIEKAVGIALKELESYEDYPTLAIRRAFRIFGYRGDPGTYFFLGLSDPKQAAEKIGQVYEEAANLIEVKATELELSASDVLNQSNIVALFHRFVDPLTAIYEYLASGKYPIDKALPGGGVLVVREREDGIMEVRINGVFGNNRLANEGGGDEWIYWIYQDGSFEEIYRRITMKDSMLCTTKEAAGKYGEELVEVPAGRKTRWSMDLNILINTIQTAIRSYRQINQEKRSCDQSPIAIRLEISEGYDREGRRIPVITGAERFEEPEVVAESFEGIGGLFVLDSIEDLVKVEAFLDKNLSLEKKSFIGFRKTVISEKRNDLVFKLIDLLRRRQDRQNIVILHPSSNIGGHQISHFGAEGLEGLKYFYVRDHPLWSGSQIRFVNHPDGPFEIKRQVSRDEVLVPLEQAAYVEFLNGSEENLQLGNKAVNLSRVRREGFQIEPGIVLSPHVFYDLLHANGIYDLYQDLRALNSRHNEAEAKKIAQQIRDSLNIIPDSIFDRITSQLQAYFPAGVPTLVVRSCADIEDGKHHNFAGVYDSVVNVQLTNLKESLLQVFRSLFSDDALTYIYINDPNLITSMTMSPIIQRFKDVETENGVSMVLYTEDVQHRQDGVAVLNYAEGRSPEFVVDGNGRTVRFNKKSGVIIGEDGKTVPLELLDVIPIAERICNRPADIECVVDEDGSLTVLQLRPR